MENCKISTEYDGKLRTLYLKICTCGKDMWVPKHVFNRRKYCSRFCHKDETKKLTVTCRLCSKEFKRYKFKLKGSKHGVYFCSRKCKDFGQRIESGIEEIQPHHYGVELLSYRDKIEILKCISCECNFKPILIVHHKDGNHSNNDAENLEVVCPTCHCLRHMKLQDNKWIFSYTSLTPRELLFGPWDCTGWSSHLQ